MSAPTIRAVLPPADLDFLSEKGWRYEIAPHPGEVRIYTLRAQRGDTVWAFFRYPVGLTLRSSAKKLAPGVSVLASGESCPIPPSAGGTWLNSWAEIEAVPSWLRELAFESPNTPPGEAIAVRTPSPRPAPCRSAQRFEKQHRRVQNGYPNFNQGGWGRGFRPSRRQSFNLKRSESNAGRRLAFRS